MASQPVSSAPPLSFANDPFSIAASIILLPLIIEVVQMTIFLRSRGNCVRLYQYQLIGRQHTFLLLRDEPQCRDFRKRYTPNEDDEYSLLAPAT